MQKPLLDDTPTTGLQGLGMYAVQVAMAAVPRIRNLVSIMTWAATKGLDSAITATQGACNTCLHINKTCCYAMIAVNGKSSIN